MNFSEIMYKNPSNRFYKNLSKEKNHGKNRCKINLNEEIEISFKIVNSLHENLCLPDSGLLLSLLLKGLSICGL